MTADLVTVKDDIDLGSYGAKWKHGWIPLNAAATALKAKQLKAGGNHSTHTRGDRKITVAPSHGGGHGAIIEHPDGTSHYIERTSHSRALAAAMTHSSVTGKKGGKSRSNVTPEVKTSRGKAAPPKSKFGQTSDDDLNSVIRGKTAHSERDRAAARAEARRRVSAAESTRAERLTRRDVGNEDDPDKRAEAEQQANQRAINEARSKPFESYPKEDRMTQGGHRYVRSGGPSKPWVLHTSRQDVQAAKVAETPKVDEDKREMDYGPVVGGDRVVIHAPGHRAGSAAARAHGSHGVVHKADSKNVTVHTDDGGEFKVPRAMVKKNNSGLKGGPTAAKVAEAPKVDEAERRDHLESIKYGAKNVRIAEANHREQARRTAKFPSGASGEHAVNTRKAEVDKGHAALDGYRKMGYGKEVDAALSEHENVAHTLPPLRNEKQTPRRSMTADKAPAKEKTPMKKTAAATARRSNDNSLGQPDPDGSSTIKKGELKSGHIVVGRRADVEGKSGVAGRETRTYVARMGGDKKTMFLHDETGESHGFAPDGALRFADSNERQLFRNARATGAKNEMSAGDANRRRVFGTQGSLFGGDSPARATKTDSDTMQKSRAELSGRLNRASTHVDENTDPKTLRPGQAVSFRVGETGRQTEVRNGHVVHADSGLVHYSSTNPETGKLETHTAVVYGRGKKIGVGVAQTVNPESTRDVLLSPAERRAAIAKRHADKVKAKS